MARYRILVINPGSTSTKISVFHNETEVFTHSIAHSAESLAPYPEVKDQYRYRLYTIKEQLANHDQDHDWQAITGRGGFMKPIPSGIYRINTAMIQDLENPLRQHASNLGGLIAYELAEELGIPSYIVDPVVVDELEPVARISGYAGFARKSYFHPLNHKATARRLAADLGRTYEGCNFIIAHIGGGITVGAHKRGRVVDVNNGMDGEGPFSSERAGTLPVGDIVRLCFSGRLSEQEVLKQFTGKGGMVSYLGTNDIRDIVQLHEGGDELAGLLLDAMAYQIAKEIGAAAAVMEGKVDAIGLTGGAAHCRHITDYITKKVRFIAPVHLYPGENEMQAMALGALRVLRGETKAREYDPQ